MVKTAIDEVKESLKSAILEQLLGINLNWKNEFKIIAHSKIE
ncbi:MAG: hypothetical protein ACOVLC_10425 [Flavobacterium sp.]